MGRVGGLALGREAELGARVAGRGLGFCLLRMG